MKKFFSTVFAFGLILVGLVVFNSAPAHAGGSPNIIICHATGSDTNPYVSTPVSKTAIVKGVGHGSDKNDIIPAFEYAEKTGDPLKTYPGLNWTVENKALYENSCVRPLKVVTPTAPVYSPGTCILPQGAVNLATQPEGVLLNSRPVLDGNIWKVSYTPAAGYKFATETSGIFAFTVIGPNASDPTWDVETGGCGLPNVGAGDLMSYVPYALGLFALGSVFALIGARRRQTA